NPADGLEAHPSIGTRDQLYVSISWDVGTQIVTGVGTNLLAGLGSSGSAPFTAPATDISAIEFTAYFTAAHPGSDVHFLGSEGIVVTGVPEPATAGLVGIGGLLILWRRRGSCTGH